MKFSITVPAYKARFLSECIDSILNQTFPDYELIIVNDASPEDLDSIVARYNDVRIRYYKNENNIGAVRVVDNWNRCLQYAKGEYIICMGDDDMLATNCLDEYNRLINRFPGLDVYHGRTKMIDENSEFCNIQEDRPEYESAYSMIWHLYFKRRCQFIGDFLFRTQALRDKGGFYFCEYALGADWLTTFMMAKEKGIANTHMPIFLYRDNPLTISRHTTGVERMDSVIRNSRWMDDFLKDEPANVVDRMYWIKICEHQQTMNDQARKSTIRYTLDSHFFKNLVYWVITRRKYNLTLSTILIGIMYSLFDRMKSLYKKIKG